MFHTDALRTRQCSAQGRARIPASGRAGVRSPAPLPREIGAGILSIPCVLDAWREGLGAFWSLGQRWQPQKRPGTSLVFVEWRRTELVFLPNWGVTLHHCTF